MLGCGEEVLLASCSSGLEYGRFSFSAEGDGTARLAEERGAAEVLNFNFVSSLSSSVSVQGGASYEGALSSAVERAGVSGIAGS